MQNIPVDNSFIAKLGKYIILFGLLFTICLINACVDIHEQIFFNPDGSGKIIIKTRTDVPADEIASFLATAGRWETPLLYYPPFSKNELNQLFPGKSFNIKMQNIKNTDSVTTMDAIIEFTDINALMASPYGSIKSLQINKENNIYTLRAKTGVEPLLQMLTNNNPLLQDAPPAIKKTIKDIAEFKYMFSVTLPDKPLTHNGKDHEKTIKWSFGGKKSETQSVLVEKASKIMKISFQLSGTEITPRSQPRLDLDLFNDLKERTIMGSAMPDAKQIQSDSTFIPCKIVIKQSFDMAGLSSLENYLSLIGIVEIAKKTAPQKIGEIRLIEIIDSFGNALTFNNKYNKHIKQQTPEINNTKTKSNLKKQYLIQFQCAAPDPSAEKLAKFKGEIDLIYFSKTQIIKIPNILTDDHVTRNSLMNKRIQSQGLIDAGINLVIQYIYDRAGMLSITMTIKAKGSIIKKMQIYDQKNHPVITFSPATSYGDYIHVIIPEKTVFPISLALIINGGSSIYRLPVEINNLKLNKNSKGSK